MKLYRITHNIQKCLPLYLDEQSRYFTTLSIAHSIFVDMLDSLDCGNDEWISLEEIHVKDANGELMEVMEKQLRFNSHHTTVGASFDPEQYIRSNG